MMQKSFVRLSLALVVTSVGATVACVSRGFGEEEPDDEIDVQALKAVPAAAAGGSFFARDGQLSQTQLYARTAGSSLSSGLKGMDFVRPVLKGVLYRGGFTSDSMNGGQSGGLSSTHQSTLCNLGFNDAFGYLDYGRQSGSASNCGGTGDSFQYVKGSDFDHTAMLNKVWETINKKNGKVFVHCRWGVHASGFAATVALNQFCGGNSNGSTAAVNYGTDAAAYAYWDKARNKSPASASWFNDRWAAYKAKKFNYASKITRAQQDEICPDIK